VVVVLLPTVSTYRDKRCHVRTSARTILSKGEKGNVLSSMDKLRLMSAGSDMLITWLMYFCNDCQRCSSGFVFICKELEESILHVFGRIFGETLCLFLKEYWPVKKLNVPLKGYYFQPLDDKKEKFYRHCQDISKMISVSNRCRDVSMRIYLRKEIALELTAFTSDTIYPV
jgi:hypothetical protein